ncbi:hypothetical protein B0H94_11259 [Salsuginibacillus halophilus]|uniref:Uncharacterized protein n=1 Tax=Salsuginibacillus halophilus TaxID=517424 RepID=A0A2P8H9R1_9BACI|nr:hypothetical protein [Salsuginibacillus halophilus]PSL42976.1 hypothetical protein B0H94_11259 [Salsuginibacillus halophilus]
MLLWMGVLLGAGLCAAAWRSRSRFSLYFGLVILLTIAVYAVGWFQVAPLLPAAGLAIAWFIESRIRRKNTA